MRALLLPAFAVALAAGFFHAPDAEARFNAGRIEAPSLVDDIACVTRRTRTVRPNGRVVVRTVRECGVPAYRTRRFERCRTVVRPAYRPNGSMFYREVRVCR